MAMISFVIMDWTKLVICGSDGFDGVEDSGEGGAGSLGPPTHSFFTTTQSLSLSLDEYFFSAHTHT